MKDFIDRVKKFSPKQLLLLTVQQQKQLAAFSEKQHEPIAIIGGACRMPGGVNDLDSYWELLSQGREGVREMGQERWDMARFFDPDPAKPGKMYVNRLGLLDEVDTFDAEFFGIAPREAERLDPQQRLLLETGWQALENAGQAPRELTGSNTGVFLGICNADYTHLRIALANTEGFETITAYDGTGTTFSVAAGRISYTLGLKGPCFVVDTACSSSLVALHLAAQSLRSGECNLALAGGVNLILDPVTSVIFSKANMLAPDGRCKTFDAAADGYVRGEGCGAVVLKRLSDARADGDRILALIRGSALNQDGHSQGLTAPNEKAQVQVIQEALKSARLAPEDIDYIEAHGTGTSLGDPIEMGAIATVFGKSGRDRPLYVGSVKTNIGHTEAASGIAGILKVVASLQNEAIPPHLNFSEPSPLIPWDAMNVEIPRQATPWQRNGKRRCAGVSAFGFSGSNAHIILEEAPEEEAWISKEERTMHVLALSAKTPEAFKAQLANFAGFISAGTGADLASVCYSANAGRNHFAWRKAFVGGSMVELQSQIEDTLSMPLPEPVSSQEPGLAFLFAGQGSQYAGMGQALYVGYPAFRAVIDECEERLRAHWDRPLREILWGGDASLLDETRHTQPALFALELALARLWESWGIVPAAVLGHSVGEYAAACFAGVFSLADGLRLIEARGQLMAERCERGAMAAVFAPLATVAPWLGGYAGQLAVAAVNGPHNTVVSGSREALAAFTVELDRQSVGYQGLSVSHAFHSPMMAPMLEAFAEVAQSVTYQRPRLGVISNLTGQAETDRLAQASYWVEHVSAPVRFAQGFETLVQQGVDALLEVGPGSTLLGLGRRVLEGRDTMPGTWLASLSRGQADERVMLQSLARLYEGGATVDWKAFDAPYARRRVPVPTYPFQRKRYWMQQPVLGGINGKTAVSQGAATVSSWRAGHPLLGERLGTAFSREIYFQNALSVAQPDYMGQHRLFGLPVVAAASHIAMFLEAARHYFKTASLRLSHIAFMQPLVLPEDRAVTVQVMLSPRTQDANERDDAVTAQLMSLSEGGDPADKAAWRVHAAAAIRIGNDQSENTDRPMNIVESSTLWEQDEPAAEFYQRFWNKGYTVGDKFRWLGEGWKAGHRALRRLQTQGRDELSESFMLYPGLLDSCFQVLDCCRTGVESSGAQEDIFIPAGIGALDIYRTPRAGESLYCHARLDADSREGNGDRIVGDLWLVNEDNDLIAKVSGFESRRSSRNALKQALLPEKAEADLVYRMDWQAAASLPDSAAEMSVQEPVAVFAGQSGAAESVLGQLRNAGVETCVIKKGAMFEDEGNAITVNPDDAAQMAHLFEVLERRRAEPWHLLYLWGLDADVEAQTFSGDLQEAAQGIWLDLLRVMQAVSSRRSATGAGVKGLHVVTQSAQAPDSHTTVQPLQSLLWGMVRSAQAEWQDLRINLIDLNDDTDLTAPALARILAAPSDSGNPGPDNQWLVRGDGLWVPRLSAAAVGPAAAPVISSEKTYLITGGLGGIGLQLARWLVDQGGRHLVLLGRSGPKAGAQEALIDELTSRAQVLCLQADVADRQDLEAAFKRIGAECPELGGIFHAAGVLDDGLIEHMDAARFAKVMAPKVLGAWHLHQLCEASSVDYFVAFSSITSVLGSKGQINYAAANAFLDGLMALRRAQGKPGLSVNWGPWAEGGMSAQLDDRYQRLLKEHGLAPMSPAQCLKILERLLGTDAPAQIMVADIEWPRFLAQYSEAVPGLYARLKTDPALRAINTEDGQGGFYRRLMALPAADRDRALSDYVRQTLADVLGFSDMKRIKERDKFFELGLDSLLAVEMKSRLEKDLGTRLSTTLVFDYPTLAALTDHLREKILAPADAPSAKRDEALDDDPAASSDDRDFDAMSAEELDVLLGDRLDRIGSYLTE